MVDADLAALSGRDRTELRRRMRRMVRAASLSEATERELEVSLRLTTDAVIRQLNRDYRAWDQPTDVLSFSQREGVGGDVNPEILGDIVISVDTAARQARDANRSLVDELVFLAAHGLCHLMGYDHRNDAEEAEMNARAAALLAEGRNKGKVRAA